VALRIQIDDAGGVASVQLFGRLDAEGVEALQKACAARCGAIELDLSQLRTVDDVGAAYLRGLIDAGARVGPANPYISALLKLGGPDGRGARAAHTEK